MIEIENVRKSFGPLEVLKGINLTVNKGEVVTIIGGSGSGKSTLPPASTGLSQSTAQDRHRRHRESTPCRPRPQQTAPQGRHRLPAVERFPHLTVLENVMLAPRKVLGISRKRPRKSQSNN